MRSRNGATPPPIKLALMPPTPPLSSRPPLGAGVPSAARAPNQLAQNGTHCEI